MDNWNLLIMNVYILVCQLHGRCLFLARQPPQWARASSLAKFPDNTQRRTSIGRTPLDEWSARRRDLCLTTLTTDELPCPPRWDSNPHSQQASGRRPTPLTVRPLGPAARTVYDITFVMPLLKWVQGLQKTGTCVFGTKWRKAHFQQCPNLRRNWRFITMLTVARQWVLPLLQRLHCVVRQVRCKRWCSLLGKSNEHVHCVVFCWPPHINSHYIVTCWWLRWRSVESLGYDFSGRWFSLRLPAGPIDYFLFRSVQNDSGCLSASYRYASFNDGDTFWEMRR